MFRLVIFATSLVIVNVRNGICTNLEQRIIVGGKDGTIEDHPYQLSLQLADEHKCGATLIAPNIAVTTAHCTEEYKNKLSQLVVRAGSTIKEQGGETAKVVSICQHLKFDFPDYDVSVLKLERNLPKTKSISPIALVEKNSEIATGTVGTVSGWGSLENEGSASTVLQTLQVPKIDQERCKSFYDEDEVTDRMFCFGYEQGGKDSCQGDSGGPLVIGGKLAGVISWGYNCAYERLPGVYADVANSEIYSHIQQCIAKFK